LESHCVTGSAIGGSKRSFGTQDRALQLQHGEDVASPGQAVRVERAAIASAAAVEQLLETVVAGWFAPPYERFDGYQQSREHVARHVAEPRWFTARHDQRR
jgi:hypothetical protein